MKRRNADIGKLRRPIKRTKITEGMYGNSMLYVKFILLWSSIALADYMLEFRFEFLWPLWQMLKVIFHCYQCKGLAFTVFFTCIALTSDVICYFFIPMQILTYLAGVYVWVISIWNTFESKGVCAQTIAMWLLVVYAEALRTGVISAALSGSLADEPDEWPSKPWAASAIGFPILSLGVGVKNMLDEKLRLRTQRRVREQNEFYFRLMREAIPEGGLTSSTYTAELLGETEGGGELKQNGTAGGAKRRWKPDTNGHCVPDKEHAVLQAKLEHLEQFVERKNRVRDSSTQSCQSQKSSHSNSTSNSVHTSVQSSTQPSPHAGHANGSAKGAGFPHEDKHNHSKNGSKSTKYDKKEATTLKEERRRKKNRDIDKETIDSHKSTENTKEQIDKDIESTKECVKVKECNNILKEEEKRRDEDRKREKEEERKREKEEERKREKEEERKREREEVRKREREEERQREREEERKREREEERKRLREEERKRLREEERKREEERRREREEERKRERQRERELKEKEKEKEKERERERELLLARECIEEVSRLKAALSLSQRNEAEAARQLAAAVAAEKQRRASQADLKHQLQHKMSTWRNGERAALDRKLGEERRLRLVAEQQLLKLRRTPQGECESEWCKSRRSAADTEAVSLRKDLQRMRDRLTQSQRDLNEANEQVAALEAEKSAYAASSPAPPCAPPPSSGGGAVVALQARVAHLDHVLSSETRVKLDLLAALGDANRKMHIQESIIHRQEKQLEELKAQMLAVMPAEYVCSSPHSPHGVLGGAGGVGGAGFGGAVSKLRLAGGSPLDPNASVYTPKQLCSDA